ncbi:hypothetical protein R3P38DRAFT_3220612 [Favolaschia claudopus]|uniref:G domain-containing protein n=1 Tax=Favolaschia claudopus TaxID=2862362 RepID=A0AAV9ZS00_9AGAR
MDSQTLPLDRLPEVRFRVLVAGRANAGKTTILQRVCETTESPEVYRVVIDKNAKETRERIQLDPTSEAIHHCHQAVLPEARQFSPLTSPALFCIFGDALNIRHA